MISVRPLLLVATVALLAGCQVAPNSKGTDYSNVPPFDLRASAVLVDDVTTPSTEAGHIEGNLNPSLPDRVRTAIEGHYFANSKGATGAPELRFTVKEATITTTALPIPENGLDRLFHNYADTRYDARLVVGVDASSSGQYGNRGFAEATATRSIELGNLSEEARTRYINDMVDQLVGAAVVELDKQILDGLGGLVNPTNLGGGQVSNGTELTIVPQTSGRWDKMKNWQ